VALSLPAPHWYLATMRRGGLEAAARIERHRAMRAGKGFRVLEMQDAPAVPARGTVLLEDLGNLVANGWEGGIGEILDCQDVVLVGNEVGCDGVRYDAFTREYIERLGALTCRLAARCDAVVEVVAGVPQVLKGDLREVVLWAH
jgi:adenosylcobinamide kinase/adenosylcobinamide-phosphate guanylyltransferase